MVRRGCGGGGGGGGGGGAASVFGVSVGSKVEVGGGGGDAAESGELSVFATITVEAAAAWSIACMSRFFK